jgi:hypothetical protein
MRALIIVAAVLVSVFGKASISDAMPKSNAFQVDACPANDERALDLVMSFLSAPHRAATRTRLGVAGVDTGSVRVLAAPADTAICRQLAATVRTPAEGTRKAVYYAAGSFYFVPVLDTGTNRVGEFKPLLLFNAQLEFLESIGM